jgi:hypothetical protein
MAEMIDFRIKIRNLIEDDSKKIILLFKLLKIAKNRSA